MDKAGVDIPLSTYFTTDWFTINIPNLTVLFDGCNERPVKALEIGSWEGRSTLWFLENALMHEDLEVVIVWISGYDLVSSWYDKNPTSRVYG